MNRRPTDQLRGVRQYDVTFGVLPFASSPSHGNVCVIEPDVAGEPQSPFAGRQIAVVFVQLLDQEEGASLTNAAGNLITFHGRRWLDSEDYALEEGRRRVRYFECYADAGTVDEVWIEEGRAAVRWRPFAPGTRALSDFERQIGCSLPSYHGAVAVRSRQPRRSVAGERTFPARKPRASSAPHSERRGSPSATPPPTGLSEHPAHPPSVATFPASKRLTVTPHRGRAPTRRQTPPADRAQRAVGRPCPFDAKRNQEPSAAAGAATVGAGGRAPLSVEGTRQRRQLRNSPIFGRQDQQHGR